MAADVLQVGLGPAQCVAWHLPDLVDEYGPVDLPGHDGRIGDRQDGWRVDEDVIVLLARLLDGLLESL